VHANREGGVTVITEESTPAGTTVMANPRGPGCPPDKSIPIVTGSRYTGSTATQAVIYVANYGTDSVVHIDFSCTPTPKRIVLDAGARPFGLALHPIQGRPELWVAEYGLSRISIIDTNRDQVVDRVAVAPNPQFLLFHPEGCYAYVYTEGDGAVRRLLPAERKVDGNEMRPRERIRAENLVFANNAVNLVYDGGGEAWPETCDRLVE
jgi:DNA-binding beta-propeller fold protein YncE